MDNFKLLAIRPLKGCHERFLKNLTAGLLYPFYSSCQFYNSNRRKVSLHQAIHFVSNEIKIPSKLYQTKSADEKSLNVNISAIAGRNGSGKSTIVELLFAAIYLFSVNQELLVPNLKSLEDDSDLQRQLKEVLAEQTFLFSEKSKRHDELKSKAAAETRDPNFSELQEVFADYKNERYLRARIKELNHALVSIPDKVKEILEFRKDLKVELYFQCDDVYYKLVLNHELQETSATQLTTIPFLPAESELSPGNGKYLPVNISRDKLAEYFFYTIAVNYSHYSLNANVMGDWINTLFHKNDGYTTPVVINPMRDEGNFDINRESGFAKYRLLSNIMIEQFYDPTKIIEITGQQNVSRIKFTLNKGKLKELRKKLSSGNKGISGEPRATNMIIGLMGRVLDGTDMALAMLNDFPLKDDLMNYIVRKVDRISQLYPGFESGYQFGPEAPMLTSNDFLQSLVDDGTHITNKLLQALNFLQKELLPSGEAYFRVSQEQLSTDGEVCFYYTPQQLLGWMDAKSGAEIIRKLPPSIFDIDFELVNPSTNSYPMFSSLSSGEQQIVHTIQSVIYHINNLQSAHASRMKERIKYQAINIVYDEIELYFHPEYQRRLVSDFLKAFKNVHLKQRTRIRTINVLFLTHSPFILSDIPGENIMLLDLHESTGRSVAKKVGSETFAANINDLLADNFFLKGTLMGKFAEREVNQVIDKITEKEGLTLFDERLIALIGDDFLRISLEEYNNPDA